MLFNHAVRSLACAVQRGRGQLAVGLHPRVDAVLPAVQLPAAALPRGGGRHAQQDGRGHHEEGRGPVAHLQADAAGVERQHLPVHPRQDPRRSHAPRGDGAGRGVLRQAARHRRPGVIR